MKDNYRITRTIETYLNDDGRLIQRDRDFYGKTKEEAEFKYRQYLKATSEEEKPHQAAKEFFGKTKEEALYKYLKASSEEAGRE